MLLQIVHLVKYWMKCQLPKSRDFTSFLVSSGNKGCLPFSRAIYMGKLVSSQFGQMVSKIPKFPNFWQKFFRTVSFHSTLLPEFSRIFVWMVRFSEIHQFPEFLETFPGNFCTIIAAGSKFSKVLVELEASIISESITFYQKTSSGMNGSVCSTLWNFPYKW